ncbi:hypothetical protein LCGC14_1933870 [marine sediment metagenome]|uniref:Uncharacterized protein n=1 Tax=marine sediment metagenome TaxID=412755 RepID=A0A0F9IJU3_9ZZZZ
MQHMKISLGRGTGKIVTLKKITIYNLSIESPTPEIKQQIIDYMEENFEVRSFQA